MGSALRGRHHSCTSCQTYEACPQKFEFQYVKRLRVEREVPQAWRFGTVIHAGLEAAFKEHQGCPPLGDDCDSPANHAFAAEEGTKAAWLRENMPLSGGDMHRAIEYVHETLDRQGRVVPIDVLGVEHRFNHLTPDGTIVLGFTDLVLRLAKDTAEIRDWKVTSNMSKPEDLAHNFQLGLYGWLATVEWPWVKRVYVSHYYPTQNRLVRVLLTPDAMEDAVSRIEAVAEMVEMDNEYAPRPGEHCGDCVFQEHCPVWQRVAENPDLEAMRTF